MVLELGLEDRVDPIRKSLDDGASGIRGDLDGPDVVSPAEWLPSDPGPHRGLEGRYRGLCRVETVPREEGMKELVTRRHADGPRGVLKEPTARAP